MKCYTVVMCYVFLFSKCHTKVGFEHGKTNIGGENISMRCHFTTNIPVALYDEITANKWSVLH